MESGKHGIGDATSIQVSQVVPLLYNPKAIEEVPLD